MVASIRGPPKRLYPLFEIDLRTMKEEFTMAATIIERHNLDQTMNANNQNDEFNGAIALTRARAYLDETNGESDRYHVYFIDVCISGIDTAFRLSVTRVREDGLSDWTLNRLEFDRMTLIAIGTEHSIGSAVKVGYETAIDQAFRGYKISDNLNDKLEIF